MQCDTVLAGSRGYSQPDEYTQDAAGKSGWQRRLDIANKYEAAVTEETLSADIMDRMTERDHRRAYRDFLKLMEDSLDPEDSEDDEMLPVDDTASVHSEHLERLHFHVLGDSHRASPSAARELASAVCGLTEREYKVLYDRLLPNEQRAMNLLRDQLV